MECAVVCNPQEGSTFPARERLPSQVVPWGAQTSIALGGPKVRPIRAIDSLGPQASASEVPQIVTPGLVKLGQA